MNVIISNSSEKPIYEQISFQIKTKILNGNLKEGQSLPSIRALAKELKISVITTKRAYEDLQKEGFITTVAGKGTFVSSVNLEKLKEKNYEILEKMLKNCVSFAKSCEINLSDLKNILDTIYKEN